MKKTNVYKTTIILKKYFKNCTKKGLGRKLYIFSVQQITDKMVFSIIVLTKYVQKNYNTEEKNELLKKKTVQ